MTVFSFFFVKFLDQQYLLPIRLWNWATQWCCWTFRNSWFDYQRICSTTQGRTQGIFSIFHPKSSKTKNIHKYSGFPSSSASPTSQDQIPFGISSPTGLLRCSISWKRSNFDRTRFVCYKCNKIWHFFSGCNWLIEILAKNSLTERSNVPERAWRDFRCYRTFRIFKNYDALIQSTCQMCLFSTLSGLPEPKPSQPLTRKCQAEIQTDNILN